MAKTEPVEDWAEDYDIFDGGFVKDPYPVWQELRGQCPVAHTERWGGSAMPTTFETVTSAAKDVEHLSSIEVSVAPVPIRYDEEGNRNRSIIASDDPEHGPERRLLLPFFAPDAIEKYREPTRDLCRQLLRSFIEDGRVEVLSDS